MVPCSEGKSDSELVSANTLSFKHNQLHNWGGGVPKQNENAGPLIEKNIKNFKTVIKEHETKHGVLLSTRPRAVAQAAH